MTAVRTAFYRIGRRPVRVVFDEHDDPIRAEAYDFVSGGFAIDNTCLTRLDGPETEALDEIGFRRAIAEIVKSKTG